VYENDPDDIETLGWEKFVSDVWASIFVGHHSNASIRTVARRWSDLLQGGIGCSQDIADELVRAEIMRREDRDELNSRDPLVVLAAMDQVLADMSGDLDELAAVRPAERSRLSTELSELRQYLRDGTEEGADDLAAD